MSKANNSSLAGSSDATIPELPNLEESTTTDTSTLTVSGVENSALAGSSDADTAVTVSEPSQSTTIDTLIQKLTVSGVQNSALAGSSDADTVTTTENLQQTNPNSNSSSSLPALEALTPLWIIKEADDFLDSLGFTVPRQAQENLPPQGEPTVPLNEDPTATISASLPSPAPAEADLHAQPSSNTAPPAAISVGLPSPAPAEADLHVQPSGDTAPPAAISAGLPSPASASADLHVQPSGDTAPPAAISAGLPSPASAEADLHVQLSGDTAPPAAISAGLPSPASTEAGLHVQLSGDTAPPAAISVSLPSPAPAEADLLSSDIAPPAGVVDETLAAGHVRPASPAPVCFPLASAEVGAQLTSNTAPPAEATEKVVDAIIPEPQPPAPVRFPLPSAEFGAQPTSNTAPPAEVTERVVGAIIPEPYSYPPPAPVRFPLPSAEFGAQPTSNTAPPAEAIGNSLDAYPAAELAPPFVVSVQTTSDTVPSIWLPAPRLSDFLDIVDREMLDVGANNWDPLVGALSDALAAYHISDDAPEIEMTDEKALGWALGVGSPEIEVTSDSHPLTVLPQKREASPSVEDRPLKRRRKQSGAHSTKKREASPAVEERPPKRRKQSGAPSERVTGIALRKTYPRSTPGTAHSCPKPPTPLVPGSMVAPTTCKIGSKGNGQAATTPLPPNLFSSSTSFIGSPRAADTSRQEVSPPPIRVEVARQTAALELRPLREARPPKLEAGRWRQAGTSQPINKVDQVKNPYLEVSRETRAMEVGDGFEQHDSTTRTPVRVKARTVKKGPSAQRIPRRLHPNSKEDGRENLMLEIAMRHRPFKLQEKDPTPQQNLVINRSPSPMRESPHSEEEVARLWFALVFIIVVIYSLFSCFATYFSPV